MTTIINPYKHGSRGANALKKALTEKGVKCFILKKKQPSEKNVVLVNWGNSEFDYDIRPYKNIVNHPGMLTMMTNKGRFFNRVGHSPMVPEWTQDAKEAMKWKGKYLARTLLEASGGRGIIVVDPEREPGITAPKAPLYVKYQNKSHEYRIHMGRGLRGGEFEPLLIQRKIFQKDAKNPQPRSWEIRNHSNGFIFVQNSGYPTPHVVTDIAKKFMNEFFAGLHFAALDIIFHEKKNQAWVLEGNTAPGLEGNTIDVYSDYFKNLNTESKRA